MSAALPCCPSRTRRFEPHLTEPLKEFNEIDTARLTELKNRLFAINPSVQVDTLLAYGDPAREILKAIDSNGATFVIMGRQGRGFFEEILVDGISQKIVRHAPVSVILVPLRRP